jgi:hypothetical protein
MTDAQPDIGDIKSYLLALQDRICAGLADVDGSAGFREDAWQHGDGGGGRTRVLEQGGVFEQAGVNFSHVRGPRLPAAATARRPELAGRDFEALGVSLVVHPQNPYVPTSHMNVRFFIAGTDRRDPVWWFGGGFDLTPYYPFTDDVVHWHTTARDACQDFGADVYPRCFSMISTSGITGRASPSCAALVIITCPPTNPSYDVGWIRNTVRDSATGSSTGEGVTWSSTWSTIGAPCLACSLAGVSSPYSCPCRPR